MIGWYITEMNLRYQERLREAEHLRLLSEVSQAEPYSRPTDRALAALGRAFTRWGKQLEESHSAATTPSFGVTASDYLKLITEPATSQSAVRMVALDGCGAAHKHVNMYSHSHRG